MATEHPSPALRGHASSRPYPMASPGYGKRSAPDQQPRGGDDFMLLPLRERSIAGFIDRLPEGAAMDVKGLAGQLPLYGQQAVASALKALSVAGYLRRVRCLVGGGGGPVRWVFRTFWSRTARDNEWWAALLADEGERAAVRPADAFAVPQQRTQEQAPARAAGPAPAPAAGPASPVPAAGPAWAASPVPAAGPARAVTPAPAVAPAPAAAPVAAGVRAPVAEGPSPAYLALAGLGRVDARLALSGADCKVLEQLAAEWLARGVDTAYLTQALTAGLPPQVDSPVGFVRRRLTDKIPARMPSVVVPPVPEEPVRRTMMECTKCRVPGRPEALPDGLCRSCRSPGQEVREVPVELPSERDVRAYVAGLRDALKAP
ncbi:MarR family transcriptional regulator [Streptomyces atroolivaceus]|uniref:MarR family transcriptional regulator n=1 Tax=Streptomyces atroolivaceus TaxID=66869 RepID=UPI00365A0736